jgi:hypothetical protein
MEIKKKFFLFLLILFLIIVLSNITINILNEKEEIKKENTFSINESGSYMEGITVERWKDCKKRETLLIKKLDIKE